MKMLTSNSSLIRWGIIGCGNVTEVKSGPGFRKAQGSQLVAVMRRNSAAAHDYAHRHGVPRAYDDADALISDAEVDAVYVATPPSPHHDHTLQALTAGKPAYEAQPMASRYPHCVSMNDSSAVARVQLFVT